MCTCELAHTVHTCIICVFSHTHACVPLHAGCRGKKEPPGAKLQAEDLGPRGGCVNSYVRLALATLCQLDRAQRDPGHRWASALTRTQLRCPSCQWRRARWRLKSRCLWEDEPGSLGDFLGWLAQESVFPRTLRHSHPPRQQLSLSIAQHSEWCWRLGQKLCWVNSAATLGCTTNP